MSKQHFHDSVINQTFTDETDVHLPKGTKLVFDTVDYAAASLGACSKGYDDKVDEVSSTDRENNHVQATLSRQCYKPGEERGQLERICWREQSASFHRDLALPSISNRFVLTFLDASLKPVLIFQ